MSKCFVGLAPVCQIGREHTSQQLGHLVHSPICAQIVENGNDSQDGDNEAATIAVVQIKLQAEILY